MIKEKQEYGDSLHTLSYNDCLADVDHEGSVSTGGSTTTNLHLADDISRLASKRT